MLWFASASYRGTGRVQFGFSRNLSKYFIPSVCINISKTRYADYISFINHNRPVPPVTIEDMNSSYEFRNRNYLNPEIKEMFFALDLIESYGSGIRRAKNAMKDNGSPELVFEPNNEVDDYTMVTAFINEEYQKIQCQELGLGGEKADKKPIKADKKPIKSR